MIRSMLLISIAAAAALALATADGSAQVRAPRGGHGPQQTCLQANPGGLAHPGAAAKCNTVGPQRNITITDGVQATTIRFRLTSSGGTDVQKTLNASENTSFSVPTADDLNFSIEVLEPTGWHKICAQVVPASSMTGDVNITALDNGDSWRCQVGNSVG